MIDGSVERADGGPGTIDKEPASAAETSGITRESPEAQSRSRRLLRRSNKKYEVGINTLDGTRAVNVAVA